MVSVTCRSVSHDSGATPALAQTQSQPAQAQAKAARVPVTRPPSGRTEDEQNTIDVFRRSANAAVFVTQHQLVVDYFRGRALEVPAGSGSGFVWDKKGHVVTNFHVIQNAKKLIVTLHDQKSFAAEVVGAEPRKDIAVLRIKAPSESLVPITPPRANARVEVGEKVIAIGNPFGLDQTLTTGVVSALGREVDGIGGVTIREMIQTDAAINPGNSGGPLLDSAGCLIGMNTMIYSRSGASAGIGFAVPASAILRVVPQIIRTGRAEQVGIGVEIDPSQRLERHFGIRGVVVLQVTPGSPAERAGLRGIRRLPTGLELGDVIVGIAGQPIQDYDDLYNTLDQHRAGEKLVFKFVRDGQPLEKPVELIVLP
ncbi:MAG: trypsin-like peptidase domain-containing protein [Polyangiaceae bacterium]|nr:trypsin-like peptidase domain-containing protein [Polyangiaceae bacterium]